MNENGAVIMIVNFEVISRGKVRFASTFISVFLL